ncbi:MAG: hypothetical protein IPJ75_03800 [Ignavibacteriales bacterium]|nr:hypothetical protein [Ignavibacteriales bacterium]
MKNGHSVFWDLSVAASQEMRKISTTIYCTRQIYETIIKKTTKYKIEMSNFSLDERVRFKDFKRILELLKNNNLYPIFFVDEFSFIKSLMDRNTINSAFLHTIRQYTLDSEASFIFSGTYDIKQLLGDAKYGITGQLVNAIEHQVSEISEKASEELISVIDDKLSFTPEAVDQIQFLSGRIPYFIQIICKFCGYYAVENKRRTIGYPELERVIEILIGKVNSSDKSLVKKLPENVFQNNQFSPLDPKEVSVLITSLAHYNKDELYPRGVGFHELQKLWADRKLIAYRPKLADSINLLIAKKIIFQEEDEGLPVYKFTVDLFRRWWTVHHPDILGYFEDKLIIRSVQVSSSEDWEVIYEELQSIKGVIIQKMFEEVVLLFSELIEKTIYLLIDEYEYLFRYSFDNPNGFMRLRNFQCQQINTVERPSIF